MERKFHWLAGTLCVVSLASGQATSDSIDVKTVAEVEVEVTEDGQAVRRLLPAERVVPGDRVVYSLEIRNTGATDVVAPCVVRPVPDHMAYVADSAAGPGAEVSYSIDGGLTFDRADRLKIRAVDGRLYRANARDYTHIRWQLKYTLKSRSVAFARFRATVR